MQVLLLKRGQGTRFLPGAYVFPGGRVDHEDEAAGIHAFPLTALRETFEETGILILAGGTPCLSFPLEGDTEGSRLRRATHTGEISFSEVLDCLSMTPDPGRLTPIGHWVTPVQEAFRYDTLFFGVEVPEKCQPYPDGTELAEAAWLTPGEALNLNREGSLPMVFPTILTLHALEAFSSPGEALRDMEQRKIPRLLPEVEEAGDGIRMTVETEGFRSFLPEGISRA